MVFVPLTRFPKPCASLPISLENPWSRFLYWVRISAACTPEFFLWKGQVLLGKLQRLPLHSPLYGWPVRVSAGGTCGVGFMRGDPPLVVVLGVALVDGMESLWVA